MSEQDDDFMVSSFTRPMHGLSECALREREKGGRL